LPGPLPHFKPILENWCKIVVSWCDRISWEDCPWWYGERASLGLFALAAWEFGTAPIEEYSTEKGKGRARYTGRGDLLIPIGEKDYIIEAKQKWISISHRVTKGEIKLDDAILYVCDDVRNSTEFRGKRAGLVFAVPYLPESEEEFMDERLGEFVHMLRDRDDCAVAWVFPEQARCGYELEGYLYPGIAVLIRPLRRTCEAKGKISGY
jgi:hypothetical protein